MRIHFERAGGFAAPAMRQKVTIDPGTLPADEARSVADLVKAADLPALANRPRPERARPRPDAFHYRITVEDGGTRSTVEASDGDVPAALVPLIDWLSRRT
jgi:hypothetical protein